MRLIGQRVRDFHEQDFLFLPNLFSAEAVAALMFHGNLVHGAAGNITPYPRKSAFAPNRR